MDPPPSPSKVTCRLSGVVNREEWITIENDQRSDVTLAILIPEYGPALDGFLPANSRAATYDEDGGPYPLQRWPQQPKFDPLIRSTKSAAPCHVRTS